MVDFSPESKVNATDNAKAFQIIPNPASSEINVSFEEGEKAVLSINSLDGKNILTQAVNNREPVDVSSLARGYYLLGLETQSGNKGSQKLILK